MRSGLYGSATNSAKRPFVAFPKEYYHIYDLRVVEYDWESKDFDKDYIKLGPMELISWDGEDDT